MQIVCLRYYGMHLSQMFSSTLQNTLLSHSRRHSKYIHAQNISIFLCIHVSVDGTFKK